MKHLSLAARHRPQTFGEVIGQHLAATALSRAAATDKIAPAYLLSGTRGVGKTTIARIFAKALNCERAPGPEPCNECRQCQQITNGSHVDVNEIDGASNTGVDDVRALRENIGYMPMEGRYKIFIVDEAHMLSKNAFNALLKTLEEPPSHTVFIFATTEAHRFPATIISRCQHFVFRHLPEDTIFNHLENILEKEHIHYESAAVRMIARRAAGSARDSLSLLDQVLSLCSGTLDTATTRESLGLAGKEFFEGLFEALHTGSCPRVMELCRQMLGSGVDIGFFIRELAGHLRNLFLYRQAGEAVLPSLGLSGDETDFIRLLARPFSPGHLHAAWQMTLQAQRGLAQNPEPGSALELLLINLALLPNLLPVGDLPPKSSTPAPSSSPLQQPTPPTREGKPQVKEEESGAASPSQYSWAGFRDFCAERRTAGKGGPGNDLLGNLDAEWEDNQIVISISGESLGSRLEKNKQLLMDTLREYCKGNVPKVEFRQPEAQKPRQEMMSECINKPEIRLCGEILGATLTDCVKKRR